MSRRVRALFGAVNFWAIVMYNLVSLNSLEFTELVARRLILTGKGQVRGCGTCPTTLEGQEPLIYTMHTTHKRQGPRQGAGCSRHHGFSDRLPPDHAGHLVCHLLWRPAGKGAGENPSPGGAAEGGQREDGVGPGSAASGPQAQAVEPDQYNKRFFYHSGLLASCPLWAGSWQFQASGRVTERTLWGAL